jgi:inositol polyphosphate 5-phosphatase INPP5B/F
VNTPALESTLIHWVVPTCFAQSLDSLILLPGPVKDSAGRPLLPSSKALNAPRELMRILDWLMVHPLVDNPDELFLSRSPPELLTTIREVGIGYLVWY